jgi:hypothetical protein
VLGFLYRDVVGLVATDDAVECLLWGHYHKLHATATARLHLQLYGKYAMETGDLDRPGRLSRIRGLNL